MLSLLETAAYHCVLVGSSRLLNFIAVIGEDVAEPRPALLGHGDGGAEIGLDLRYAHVDAAIVLSDVEVEVFVVNVHMSAFRQVGFVGVLVRTELVQEVGQSVTEFYHSLSWDCNLKNKTKRINSYN